jgi:hypothetical protein
LPTLTSKSYVSESSKAIFAPTMKAVTLGVG